MIRRQLAAAAAVAVAVVTTSAGAQDKVHKSILHDFKVVTVVDSLINPWSIAWLPNGDMLVTERPGRLRIVRKGKLVAQPVGGVPTVVARGQGGLLDVVVHPDFANNKYVYLSYSKPIDGDTIAATTAVARGRFENDQLVDVKDVWIATTRGAPGHFGSRIAFDKQGYMFVSVGDRMVPPAGNLEAHPAQDIANNHGSINRLKDDGTVPPDNPWVDTTRARPELWTKGHRNVQALMVHPVSGNVWATEHGPQGGDELNLIQKGKNYGWPVIGFGVNYQTGKAIHSGTMRAGMENAKHVWVPSIGVSGITYYDGNRFPGWKGSVFAGGLSGEQVARFSIDGESAQLEEVIIRKAGRVRDVRQGPDGYLYLAIDDRQGKPTPIVRLEPVKR